MADSLSVTGKASNVKQIYIDWKQLTAKEVIKKEKEGQSAPPEILKWAEEIAKLDNAPDDVTYDIAKGETDIDKLNELINAAPEKQADNEENAEEPQLSAAQQERKSMQDNGASLVEQGKTFIGRSKEASSESFRAMISGSMAANSAEGVSEKAEKEAQIIEMVTRNTKKEYDNLMQKAEDKNGEGVTASELNRIQTLGEKLNTVGTQGQNKLRDRELEVNTYESRINGLENVPTNALDYGAETSFIGTELINGKKVDTNAQENGEPAQTTPPAQDDVQTRTANALEETKNTKVNLFAALFNSKVRTGLQAIRQGASTIGRGNTAENVLNNSSAKVDESKNQINKAKNKIEDSTNVSAKETPTDNKTDNQDNTTDNQDENNKNTLADSTITTDVDEIIKRKLKKGITDAKI